MRISDWSSDVCSSDLQIVLLHAGHAFLLRGFESPLPESNPVFAAVDVLLRNATIYFSMISGIIYARIFCSRPYAPFMKARLVNTGVPYLAITAIFTTLLWLRSSSGEAGNKRSEEETSELQSQMRLSYAD